VDEICSIKLSKSEKERDENMQEKMMISIITKKKVVYFVSFPHIFISMPAFIA
jgi:hypothetical protein